jgi:hypothetical protein
MDQRLVWLIFPCALIAMSGWLLAGRGGARLPIAIVLALSVLACLRQVSLFWRKGQTTYASITVAAILIAVAVTLIVALRAS